jgi:hypothetical protein
MAWSKSMPQRRAETAAWLFLIVFVVLSLFAMGVGVDATSPLVVITISGVSLIVLITTIWPRE